MALPTFSMRQLLESGVHFGHRTRRWNPKMAPYIFGVRNDIHIIDLRQTVPLLHQSMVAVRDIVAAGGRVLFVGTKRQASDKIADAAKRCGQYFVNHRWLGGMLTNWQTISNSIKRLREVEESLAEENVGLTKKELLRLQREGDNLNRALGGIKEMGGLPDVLFVIDTNREAIAVAEANKLGIPVAAIIDSNSSPDGITYPIPGNDDAIRAIDLYCGLMGGAVLDGIQVEITASGGDVGDAEGAPAEDLSAVVAEEAPAEDPSAPVAEEAPAVDMSASVAVEAPAVDMSASAAEEAPAEDLSAVVAAEGGEAASADSQTAQPLVDEASPDAGMAGAGAEAEASPPPETASPDSELEEKPEEPPEGGVEAPAGGEEEKRAAALETDAGGGDGSPPEEPAQSA
jgi:small subunit ribosomal protein S2